MKKPPNKKELEHILKLKSFGCAVREQAFAIGDDCAGHIEYHHITDCGRRMGHFVGIPLCYKHHQSGKISIGKSKKTFRATYGHELELMKKYEVEGER